MFLKPSDLGTSEIEADAVVIGAGAAGISITQSLHARGVDVLLVEGGGLKVEKAAQDLFQLQSIGTQIKGHLGRYRVFGGTTVAWTGRCAPLDAIDFERRAWMPDSGWPIQADDLKTYYASAARLIGFSSSWQNSPEWYREIEKIGGRPDTVEAYLWRLFSIRRKTFQNFGEMAFPSFNAQSGPRVLIEADLVGLESHPGEKRIAAGRLIGRNGEIVRAKARTWILCCGGIENARLLLNFADQAPPVFSTTAPALGRYFMQHPRAVAAEIVADGAQTHRLQQTFNLFRRPGLHYEAGFAFPAAAQRKLQLLNASAVLRYSATGYWDRPDRMVRRVASAVLGYTPILPRPKVTLHVDIEQVPDRASRICLQGERDAIGLRKASIDWRISEPERRTVATFTRGICTWLEEARLGKGKPVEDLDVTGALTGRHMLESYHHIGATRMSETPQTGVVDGNLRMHGIANLYVCGASVMPTGGHANPTLTIVALALRLADHIASALPMIA